MYETIINTDNPNGFQMHQTFRNLIFNMNCKSRVLLLIAICFCWCVDFTVAQNKNTPNTIKSDNQSNFTKLFDFDGTNSGSYPEEIIKSGSFLYGTTSKLYKIKTDGTGFTDFALADINEMGGSITISDTILFGIKYDFYGYGYIFSVSINGMGYKNICSFTDENLPRYSIMADEDAIYGLKYGKYDGFSYFFKIDSDGSNFERFAQVGIFPYGKILIDENYVYGTTAGPIDDEDNLGTVYKVKKDGTGYKKMHLFTNVESGKSPLAPVISIDQVLYGSTKEGGVNDCGIIFKINKDGTNFKILHHFTPEEGYGVRANLVFSGNALYGAAYQGGNSDQGTLFKIYPDGSGFQKLYDFQGIDGYRPVNLVLSGDTIFGVTRKGGLNDRGTIFRYVIDESQITPVGALKTITLSISKPEEITLKTKTELIIDKGNLIDLDTTFSVEGNIAYTHSWNVKTENNYQEVDNKVNVNQNTTFYLFIITAQGCTYTDSVTVQVKYGTGIEESVTHENQIIIYPNPNPGIFQIEILEGNANYQYDIFDISGRKVANGNIICQANECLQSIKLNNLKPGAYSLVIKKADKFYGQKKLMIQSL